MTTYIRNLITCFLLVLSSSVLAHPGHDHEHWMSEPIHALTFLAILSIGIAAIVWMKKAISTKNSEIKQQKDK